MIAGLWVCCWWGLLILADFRFLGGGVGFGFVCLVLGLVIVVRSGDLVDMLTG